jgi:plasmid stabilization system protein ParE
MQLRWTAEAEADLTRIAEYLFSTRQSMPQVCT